VIDRDSDCEEAVIVGWEVFHIMMQKLRKQ